MWPELKLLYLPVRAKAEPIRMALAFAKIPYTDVVVGYKERGAYVVCGER